MAWSLYNQSCICIFVPHEEYSENHIFFKKQLSYSPHSMADIIFVRHNIPWGYHQGNRSEALSIPALSKLGFVTPVPRKQDHFGVDFIVHLACLDRNVLSPLGKSFGIQIKS